MLVSIRKEGDDTIEIMNDLASFLMKNNIAECLEGCGFQECSTATCDFEVHAVKKRYRMNSKRV